MNEYEFPPFESTTQDDLDAAKQFLKRFHPGFWDRVEEQDITELVKIAHALFKTRPELLEATTNTRYMPIN